MKHNNRLKRTFLDLDFKEIGVWLLVLPNKLISTSTPA